MKLNPNLVFNSTAFFVFPQWINIFEIILLWAYLKLELELLFNSSLRLLYFAICSFVGLSVS